MAHVAVLTVDSLRADRCGHLGGAVDTPAIDALADRGVTFTRAYSASTHTREGVPPILTGQYPHRAVDGGYGLAAPSVATLLSGLTAGGFHSNPYCSRAYGYDADFDRFSDDLLFGGSRYLGLLQRAWDRLRGHHYARADTINERALKWLARTDGDTLLWTHYMDVHGPYEPPEPYRRQACGRRVDDDTAQDLWYTGCRTPEALSPRDRETIAALYDGEVAYTDAQIGRLLDALDDRGRLADTIVVLTADHGECLGEDDRYSHPQEVREELLHVPLIVAGPGVPDATVDVPVSTVDVVPTLLAALRNMAVETDAGVDALPGVALQSVWDDPAAYADRHVVSEATDRSAGERRYRVTAADDTLTAAYALDATNPTVDATGPLAGTLADHLRSVATASADGTEAYESEALGDRLEALGYR